MSSACRLAPSWILAALNGRRRWERIEYAVADVPAPTVTGCRRHRLIRRRAVGGLFTTVLILTCSGVARAQAIHSNERQVDVDIEWATSDMAQRTALWTAAGETINRGADSGLDALFGRADQRRRKDVFTRLGRIWLVNLPIAALTQGAVHDSGHFSRLTEVDIRSGGRHIVQWPWPVPVAISSEYVSGPQPEALTLTQELAIVGGGEQASTLMKDRLANQIYSRDTADYFDWMLLAYASLDYPVYAWTDLGGGIQGEPGDFRQYAWVATVVDPHAYASGREYFFALQDADRRTVSRLRRDAWLNLADYSLWQGVSQVVRYVATGQRRTRNSTVRIGRLGIIPSAYATLSSLGPERGVNLRLLSQPFLTSVNIRQTLTPVSGTLWGAGVGVRSRAPERLLPEGKLDAWQRIGKRPGFRLEIGARRRVSVAAHPIETSVRLGYKTEGYLLDAPTRAGLLAAVSVGTRF